jgi:hypothetical protein
MTHMDTVATMVMGPVTTTTPHITQSMAIQCHLSMLQQPQLKQQARVQQPSKQHQLQQVMLRLL